MGVLTVHLDKIENLKDADRLGKSDPYVMLHLEEDKRFMDKTLEKKKSKTIKDSLSPVFNETFTFENVPKDMDKLVLHIRVMDDDFGKDDKMGEVTIVLSNLTLSAQPKKLQEVVDTRGMVFKKTATMFLSISYTE